MVGLTSEFGFGEASRRMGLPMGLRSSDERRVALATIESILMSLRREQDTDYALGQLMQALENTQTQLLASLLDTRAPRPLREAFTVGAGS
jgi:hypothetical protein